MLIPSDFFIIFSSLNMIVARCSETEDWDHAMQCECVNEMREECLDRLTHLLIKAYKSNEDGNKIEYITGDTKQYLNKGEAFKTNQELLGMSNFSVE